MPNYTITLTQIQDDAVTFKATQLSKTKAQIFDDFVVSGLISAWIREMLDEDSSQIRAKWDLLTKIQKDQIKVIVGIKEEI